MANYFTDRVVEYPGRVIMTPVQGEANTYDMSRAEGNVTTEGTPFNAETFNGIADDIIEEADDNIITANELQTIAQALDVTPAKLAGILHALLNRTEVDTTKAYDGNGYSVTASIAGETYLGQSIDLGVDNGSRPILNGTNISGSGTARVQLIAQYLLKRDGHWYAYLKYRNNGSAAVNNATITAHVVWIPEA